jgi:hypothetical protein
MKKIIPALFCLLISVIAFAHNPLQGTKWEMKNEEGKIAFTIDFSSAASGNIIVDEKECMFMYGANHTHLFIKVQDCSEKGGSSGIIPCCDQQSIPFRGDEHGNLILIIEEHEYVLLPVR